MNILYLAHRVPYPANKGDRIRALRQIRHLAIRHRVWLGCFSDSASDASASMPLREMCEEVAMIPLRKTQATLRGLAGLATGKTVTESYYMHTAMSNQLAAWCKDIRFDVVFAFSSSMAPYALPIPASRHVLDMCDADSEKWREYANRSKGATRRMYEAEARRLACKERDWIKSFDATILITEAEAALFAGDAPAGKLQVVGNGVELPNLRPPCATWRTAAGTPHSTAPTGARSSAYPPTGRRMMPCRTTAMADRAAGLTLVAPSGLQARKANRKPTVGFIGVLDYRPNVEAVRWFVAKSWPSIRAAMPDAEFRIVGLNPTRPVRRLAQTPGVKVVGPVDDILEELLRFDVSVAPLQIARGLQNKVLEAMAAARAVVLTPQAATGINGRDGTDFILADSSVGFAVDVIRLLRDPAARRELGAAARACVGAYHNWQRELQRLEVIATGVTASKAQPVPAVTGVPQPVIEEPTVQPAVESGAH